MDDAQAFTSEAIGWAHPRHFAFMERIAEAIPDDTKTLIDVGCGSGTGLIVWSAKVPSVIGVDKSINCVLEAAKRAPCATVVHMDARDLASQGMVADVLISTAFVKNFSLMEWAKMLDIFKLVATYRIVVTIGMKSVPSDDDDPRIWHSGVRYHEALAAIELDGSWKAVDVFGHPTEPAFVMDREVSC
jgi:hypothetical protein